MDDRHASAGAFVANLRQPMPLGRKLGLLIRNRLRFPPRPFAPTPGAIDELRRVTVER